METNKEKIERLLKDVQELINELVMSNESELLESAVRRKNELLQQLKDVRP